MDHGVGFNKAALLSTGEETKTERRRGKERLIEIVSTLYMLEMDPVARE